MSVLLVHDGSALTTTTTAAVKVFSAGAAYPSDSRPYFIAEISGLSGAAGSNSAVGIQMNYLTPAGNSITLLTTGAATFQTNGVITAASMAISAPFGGAAQLRNATDNIMPMPSVIQYNFSTAGTACGLRVYAVIPNR